MKGNEVSNISQFLLKKIDYKIMPVSLKGFYVSFKAAKKNKQIFIYCTDVITKKHIKDYYFKQTVQMCKKGKPPIKLIIIAKKIDPELKKYVCHYSDIESGEQIDSPWKIIQYSEVKKIYSDYIRRESPSYLDTLLRELREPFFD